MSDSIVANDTTDKGEYFYEIWEWTAYETVYK